MILFSQKPYSHTVSRSEAAAAPFSWGQLFLPGVFWLLLIGMSVVSLAEWGAHFPFQRWLFLAILALIAEAFPVTGPRGRRLGLSDGVGLASLLLLPLPLAPVPSLLAGGLMSAADQTRAGRHQALLRFLLLSLAIFCGSIAASSLHPWAGVVVYLILRATFYTWPPALVRDKKLEIAALAASTPAALLMAVLWGRAGLPGAVLGASLMALLLMLAHFAFESALLREQVRAMERLGAVTLAQDSMTRLVERFLQLGGTLVSAERASLWLSDSSQFRLERVARVESRWKTVEGERTQALATGAAAVRFGEGLVGRVAERRLPLIAPDVFKDKRAVEAELRDYPQGSFSIMLLPLVLGGTVLGVAQFDRDGLRPYTRRDLSRVRALVNQATVAVSNSQQHRAMSDQAVTDSLSGLFNRRHIQGALESEYRRAQRYGHCLSVIMLDVDHFKSYNDTYGHVQGDVLIQMVASLLRANVRAVDIVGRYGGEEFIILMPETSKEEAAYTAERLRGAVAQTAFPGFADDPEEVVLKTISLGAATFPDDAPDSHLLVTRADQALYEAKRGGRNRVMLAETQTAGS